MSSAPHNDAKPLCRRSFGGVVLAGAAVWAASPSKSVAVPRGNGKWAQHVGDFTERETSEGFITTDVSFDLVRDMRF